MEIGSFLELQFPRGKEYWRGQSIARLNTGRAAIWHAFAVTGCRTLWLPYYQCDTVRAFLRRKNVSLKFYHINERFEPTDLFPDAGDAVLLVNYFGIFSVRRMAALAAQFPHVIVDNCQAFFASPLQDAMNVYSARKFVGAPDGAYVVGPDAMRGCERYAQGFSSDTAAFLLMRVEYGCEGRAYEARMKNEHRVDAEDVMRMSGLTRAILDGTDYDLIRCRRQENYRHACRVFREVNRLDPAEFSDVDCVPMVYPLLIEDDSLLNRLLAKKHFQGHWWSYLLDEMPAESFEYYISRFVIPITIDQRYGAEEIDYIRSLI